MRELKLKASVLSWELVIGSYFGTLLFLLYGVGLRYHGAFFLLPAALITIVVPVLDRLAGDDLTVGRLEISKLHEFLTAGAPVVFVLGNAIIIGVTAHMFGGLSRADKIFSTISVGMIGSIGITAAHELVHKSKAWSKIFGRLGLANVLYLHFEIHHIRGHHVQVGTAQDQSTAWLGESLYSFVLRTIPGCLKNSYELEIQRLKRRTVPSHSLDNLMIQFALIQGTYLTIIWFLSSWNGVMFFVLQAAIAVFMLEAVSYIEHYGLMRSIDISGTYVAMSPVNSWDFYGRFSSYLVFQLQRHADHHSHPTKSFVRLQTSEAAHKLPLGYPLLIGIAMLPPLWRRTMDDKAVARSVAR